MGAATPMDDNKSSNPARANVACASKTADHVAADRKPFIVSQRERTCFARVSEGQRSHYIRLCSPHTTWLLLAGDPVIDRLCNKAV